MNEQRSKHTNLDDSSSSDDEKDSYTPQQKKSKSEATNNKHTILKSEDRCPHCSNHKHTWANCRRYNPEAPGFWGFDKYLANGQNGGRHRPHNPLPPNHSGGYGNRGGNYGGPTHQHHFINPYESHHWDQVGQGQAMMMPPPPTQGQTQGQSYHMDPAERRFLLNNLRGAYGWY